MPVRPLALRFLEGTAADRGTAVHGGTGERERAALSTRPSYVGDDTLLASVLRIVSTRDLVAEVTVFPAVRPDRPAAYGGPVHRRDARAALARIAEAQVRTGLMEPEEQAVAA